MPGYRRLRTNGLPYASLLDDESEGIVAQAYSLISMGAPYEAGLAQRLAREAVQAAPRQRWAAHALSGI